MRKPRPFVVSTLNAGVKFVLDPVDNTLGIIDDHTTEGVWLNKAELKRLAKRLNKFVEYIEQK